MEQTRLSHPKITVLGILGSLELAPRAHWGLTGDGNRDKHPSDSPGNGLRNPGKTGGFSPRCLNPRPW